MSERDPLAFTATSWLSGDWQGGERPTCDWDARAGLLIVSGLRRAPGPLAAVLALPEAGRSDAQEARAMGAQSADSGGEGAENNDASAWDLPRKIYLRDLAREERIALFRAPDAPRFALEFYPINADGAPAGREVPTGDGRMTIQRRPWASLQFDADLARALEAAGDPSASARLRLFSTRADEGVDASEAGDSPPGAAPVGAVERLISDRSAMEPPRPFAISARAELRETDAAGGEAAVQGPTQRLHPPLDAAIKLRFAWAAEEIAAPEMIAASGFESSRAPMVEILLAADEKAAAAISDAFVFIHLPLRIADDGGAYDGAPQLARGRIQAMFNAEGRRLGWGLQYIWTEAEHRDFFGVAYRGAQPLRVEGPLGGLKAVQVSAGGAKPEDSGAAAWRVTGLYLGETARPEPESGCPAAARERFDAAIALAGARAIRPRTAAVGQSGGVDWGKAARRRRPHDPMGLELNLSGADAFTPELMAAFVDAQTAPPETEAVARKALKQLKIDAVVLREFVDMGDVVSAVRADPALSETLARAFAAPARRAGGPIGVAGALVEAMAAPDTARWMEALPWPAARALWRLARQGGDAASLHRSGLTLEDAESQTLCADTAAAARALRTTPAEIAMAELVLAETFPDFGPLAAVVQGGDAGGEPVENKAEGEPDPPPDEDGHRDAAPENSLAAAARGAERVARARAAVAADLTALSAALAPLGAMRPAGVEALWAKASAKTAEVAASGAAAAAGDLWPERAPERVDAATSALLAALGLAQSDIAEAGDAAPPQSEDSPARALVLEASKTARRLKTPVARDLAATSLRALAAGSRGLGETYRHIAAAVRADSTYRAQAVSPLDQRLEAGAEVAQLRRLARRGAARRAAPEWISPLAQARQRELTGETLSAAAAARAALSRVQRPADAREAAAALIAAASADIDAVTEHSDWPAARRLWREVCAELDALADGGDWRARPARRLRLKRSGPPETWPEIAFEAERLRGAASAEEYGAEGGIKTGGVKTDAPSERTAPAAPKAPAPFIAPPREEPRDPTENALSDAVINALATRRRPQK